jgi:hypothetical protein
MKCLRGALLPAALVLLLVQPRHHVVVLQQIHDDFCVKVRQLDHHDAWYAI